MRKGIVAAGSIALAVMAGAAAISAATDGTTGATIHGCQNLRHGLVRIVPDASACKRSEKALQWNDRGLQGDPGAAGPKGDPGPKGETGPAGQSGIPSIAALAGTSCTTFEGEVGKVTVEVAPTDLVLLTCEKTGGTPTPTPAPGPSKLAINEIDYDQPGADTGGFVEVTNIGTGAANLEGIAVVLVNGGDGVEYARKALTGSLAPGGHVVVEIDAQNGPDGVALFDTVASKLLDALSYEGAVANALDWRWHVLARRGCSPPGDRRRLQYRRRLVDPKP